MSDGSTKIKNGLNLQPVSADPSNPAEGDLQFSDGTARAKGLWQYSNGNWAEIGGGGQGGINYLAGDNSDAENGIGDWVTYADAAGENAVDGTGGTALGVTLTQNTTDPLRETADFKFSKDAADRQGEGASVDFTIDNADKAQKLTISFDYDASSANYADDDIRIAIYDVTNATLIRVNGEDLKGGKGTHLAQFQTAADSTSYRLIIHQSSTNATAYDVYLDNISVGPREVVKGAAMTDWVEYTPTSNLTTNVTHTAHYRRVGDSIEITGKISFSGSNTDSGGVFINLPSGLQADTSKDNADFETSIGHATFVNTGTASIRGVVTQTNSTAFTLRYFTDTGAQERVDTANTSVNIPFAVASGDYFYYEFSVPIQGWSSNAVTSEDLGGREVVARLTKTSTQSFGSSATVKVTFDATADYDTTSSYNGFDGWIAPESGYYDIVGEIAYDNNANGLRQAMIYVDGSLEAQQILAPNLNASTGTHIQVAATGVYVNKGEEINLYGRQYTTGAALNVNGAKMWIAKRSSPQSQLETETVAARYTTSAGTSLSNSAVLIKFEELDYDTHNAYNTSTGVYTVPVSGKYEIFATWLLNAAVNGVNAQTYIYVNGSVYSRSFLEYGSNSRYPQDISDTIELNKGDTIEIRGGTSATSRSVIADSFYNRFTIKRLK